MRCAGCDKELEVGDKYIEDTPSGFMETDISGHDDLMVTLLGGSGGKIFFCEDCTEPGGDYMFSTYYGDEEDNNADN
jgi:hypothetical protein